MEKRQFRVLYREFLFRMVDLELLSAHAQGDISKLLGQFGALLVFVSVLLGIAGALSIGDGVPGIGELIGLWTTQHFLVATTMLVVGLFAVLSWDSTFPNRRDVLVLAPLPLRTRTLFLAKIAAVATALALTVAALHIVAGLVWPFAFARAGSEGAPALTFDAPMPPVTAALARRRVGGGHLRTRSPARRDVRNRQARLDLRNRFHLESFHRPPAGANG